MNYKNEELARLITSKSLKIEKGMKVHIKYKSLESLYLIKCIIEEINKLGGTAYPEYYDKELENYIESSLTLENINSKLIKQEFINKFHDVFISIGSNNPFNKKDSCNDEMLRIYKIKKNELEKYKIKKQWLLLNYPSVTDAKNLNISYEEYYKYAMDAMTYDFSHIKNAVLELKKALDITNQIKIVGDNVNLCFNKNNIPSIPLLGNVNLPDGEIYTSPIRNSVNGYIKFNIPSPKNNLIFEDVELFFKDGKIIKFNCKNNKNEFERIISIDENAKYIGEFAFGFNNFIQKPMYDILYDEKMGGSFHIALGNAYKNAYNGNISALHWDLIYQNNENNKCDIYFDDILYSSNGNFVDKKLRKLNKK